MGHAACGALTCDFLGVCAVNNEYCVMFKRGAFDLGATVCPVAIKYNKIFVDAFWNSKRQSFTAHLVLPAPPAVAYLGSCLHQVPQRLLLAEPAVTRRVALHVRAYAPALSRFSATLAGWEVLCQPADYLVL